MSTKNKNNGREQARNYVLIILPIALVVFGWWNVINTANNLEDNTIQTFQEAQLEVVENAGNAARLYFRDNLSHPDADSPNTGLMEVNAPLKAKITKVENEVQNQFVLPIKIGNVGDAFIYSPDYAVFDPSSDFPAEYIGKSMGEIFEVQKDSGAYHYEYMTSKVEAGEEGTGWYVWDPEKAKESTSSWEFLTKDVGREIAAWKPIVVTLGSQFTVVNDYIAILNDGTPIDLNSGTPLTLSINAVDADGNDMGEPLTMVFNDGTVVTLSGDGRQLIQEDGEPLREYDGEILTLSNNALVTLGNGSQVVVNEGTQLTWSYHTQLVWVIGMSAMLPDLMTENGAYDQIQTNILQMTVVTIVVIALFWFLFRAQAQVQELRQQVQELRVEIDQSKRAEQVSEIVESEYFQDLAKRAKELRSRND